MTGDKMRVAEDNWEQKKPNVFLKPMKRKTIT